MLQKCIGFMKLMMITYINLHDFVVHFVAQKFDELNYENIQKKNLTQFCVKA